MRALSLYGGLRRDLNKAGPEYSTRTKILRILQTMYKTTSWRIPDDFMQYTHFVRSVESLEWQSSPGYPYMFEGTTNEQYFCRDKPELYQTRLLTTWTMVQARINGTRTADLIRLFVKAEPVKIKKLEEGRVRLISSVGLIDQLLDTMLFGPFNDILIERCLTNPNKAGWSPLKGGWKMVPNRPKLAIDKSTWDWSVCAWILELELELREILCENVNDEWKRLASQRYRELFFAPLFINSAGIVLRQKEPGVMKSGCKNTIATNSICQVILHVYTSIQCNEKITDIWAMGDDTLQDPPLDITKYIDVLSQYCYVKHAKFTNEFAGFRFQGVSVNPLYRGKHAYMLYHLDPAYGQEIASSYILNYHRSTACQWMREFFSTLGYDLPSMGFCNVIFDGE